MVENCMIMYDFSIIATDINSKTWTLSLWWAIWKCMNDFFLFFKKLGLSFLVRTMGHLAEFSTNFYPQFLNTQIIIHLKLWHAYVSHYIPLIAMRTLVVVNSCVDANKGKEEKMGEVKEAFIISMKADLCI